MQRLVLFSGAMMVATVALAGIPSASFFTGGTPVHEVQVVARKYTFEPATIQVAAGEPVRLVVRSADAVHGFAIRELKVDIRVPRGGEAVTLDFTAPPPGRYEIVCSEFCGSGHSHMNAALVSVAATQTAR
jgi:cytochrome c oxidase subunit 2